MTWGKRAFGTHLMGGLWLSGILMGALISSATAAPALPPIADVPVLTARAAPKPVIIDRPLPKMDERRRAMAEYSLRRYGKSEWRLTPKQIVLHYTAGPTMISAWNTMATRGLGPNASGERPQPFSHFIVDADGRIYQVAPLSMRARHAVGVNHVAIGIEFVEPRSALRILRRPAQLAAGLRLVRWLQGRYGIATTDVIGHAMANSSRFFVDLSGRRNTHVDWRRSDVMLFRAKL